MEEVTYNKTSIEQDIMIEVQKAIEKQKDFCNIMESEYKNKFGNSNEIEIMLDTEVFVNGSPQRNIIR